jgi:hypothetical protein
MTRYVVANIRVQNARGLLQTRNSIAQEAIRQALTLNRTPLQLAKSLQCYKMEKLTLARELGPRNRARDQLHAPNSPRPTSAHDNSCNRSHPVEPQKPIRSRSSRLVRFPPRRPRIKVESLPNDCDAGAREGFPCKIATLCIT